MIVASFIFHECMLFAAENVLEKASFLTLWFKSTSVERLLDVYRAKILEFHYVLFIRSQQTTVRPKLVQYQATCMNYGGGTSLLHLMVAYYQVPAGTVGPTRYQVP